MKWCVKNSGVAGINGLAVGCEEECGGPNDADRKIEAHPAVGRLCKEFILILLFEVCY